MQKNQCQRSEGPYDEGLRSGSRVKKCADAYEQCEIADDADCNDRVVDFFLPVPADGLILHTHRNFSQ
jgi:hypothetical protein